MHPSKERIGRNLDELSEMSDEMKNARNEILPSKYWEYLNKTIEGKINLYGFENFKRTYVAHYFTFYLSPFSNKIKNLSSDLPLTVKIKLLSKIFKKHSILGWRRSLSYNMLTTETPPDLTHRYHVFEQVNDLLNLFRNSSKVFCTALFDDPLHL